MVIKTMCREHWLLPVRIGYACVQRNHRLVLIMIETFCIFVS